MDRNSTNGFVIRFFDNVIYWKSKNQGVTKSATVAEYIALSESVSEIKVTLNLLKDLKLNIEKWIKIYEDNSGAIAIAKLGNLKKKIEVYQSTLPFC